MTIASLIRRTVLRRWHRSNRVLAAIVRCSNEAKARGLHSAARELDSVVARKLREDAKYGELLNRYARKTG
jgi:hypothetical protein